MSTSPESTPLRVAVTQVISPDAVLVYCTACGPVGVSRETSRRVAATEHLIAVHDRVAI